jgi:hypothetical protein
MTKAALVAIAAYVEASDRNAKDTDENWPKGFRLVQHCLDTLKNYFTPQEIDRIIINRGELKAIIDTELSEFLA